MDGRDAGGSPHGWRRPRRYRFDRGTSAGGSCWCSTCRRSAGAGADHVSRPPTAVLSGSSYVRGVYGDGGARRRRMHKPSPEPDRGWPAPARAADHPLRERPETETRSPETRRSGQRETSGSWSSRRGRSRQPSSVSADAPSGPLDVSERGSGRALRTEKDPPVRRPGRALRLFEAVRSTGAVAVGLAK